MRRLNFGVSFILLCLLNVTGKNFCSSDIKFLVRTSLVLIGERFHLLILSHQGFCYRLASRLMTQTTFLCNQYVVSSNL
jgi:hypothetical protein